MTANEKAMAHQRAWSNRRSAEHLLRGNLGRPNAWSKKMAAAKIALAVELERQIKAS